MSDAYFALSDATRREILRLLSGRELPAGEIAAAFPQQRPAISKHLAVLKRAGLVEEMRSRQQRIYAVRPGSLQAVVGFLAAIEPPTEPRSSVCIHRKPHTVVANNVSTAPHRYVPSEEHTGDDRRQSVFDLDFD
ncbi:MAG: hypothetical protein DCC65_16475 [Planctomycetota bacterium]|nr:MAG: hypothetical protein DCC65_16475 [Planctomycetota bacterium]